MNRTIGERPLSVLVVHNRYRSALPSGENSVVASEIAMLRNAGVDVHTYLRDSDEIETFSGLKRAALAASPIWSLEANRDIHSIIKATTPDVMHLHNPYPLISPSVIRVARRAGVPTVQTVHNFRFVCVNGLHFRDGHACEDCCNRRVPWPAVHHACYRGSRAQSAVMAASLSLHRDTWQMVDMFLPVGDQVADRLRMHGIPNARIAVKPNGLPDPGPPLPLGDGFLYAGRLESEKGILLLLQAWELSLLDGITNLHIAGDGPERAIVEEFAQRHQTVRFHGPVPPERVGDLMNRSAMCVVPSLVWEASPRVVVEAFARGRPVLVTAGGGAARMVNDQTGVAVDPTPAALAEALRSMLQGTALQLLSVGARRVFESTYSEDVVLKRSLELYERVRARTLGEHERAASTSSGSP